MSPIAIQAPAVRAGTAFTYAGWRSLLRVLALFLMLLALAGMRPSSAADLAENFGFSGTIGMNAAAAASATDAAGNLYITGNFEAASLTLGGVSLTRVGVKDAFAAKLDPSGTVLWARRFGGDGAVMFGKSIAVDGAGNVYLGGFFNTANLTVPALTKIGSGDAFALKLDASGNVLWARNFGGLGAGATGNAIAVDGSGNAYLAGYFYNANLTTPALALTGSIDSFLLKLDAAGTTLWATHHGGGGAGAAATSVALDGAGNIYVGGYFYNASLTTPALPKIGDQDAFVLKLDPAGSTIWARNFGGAGAQATAGAVAVDAAGNVFLAGSFKAAALTTPALARIGVQDAFAIKLDSGGARKWAKNYGGAGATAVASAAAVDGAGNLHLAGYSYDARLTTPVLPRLGSYDAFALKLDSAGNTTWARNQGGAGAQAFGSGIGIDGSGNVLVAGYFQYASLTTPALNRIGNADIYALKLDSSGNQSWARNFGGGIAVGQPGDGYVNATAVDAAGNIYIAGYFGGSSLTVGGVTLYRMGTVDAFVVKLDAMGTVLWAKNHGGNGAGAIATGLAVDGSGNVYTSGYFYSASLTSPVLAKIGYLDAYALKLDSSGATVWARAVGGPGLGANTFGNGIAVDGSGNVYLGGYFYGTNLTAPPLNKIGFRDAFAVKLDSSGNITWGKNFGGSGAGASGNAIAVDGGGNVYLGGYFDTDNLTTPPLGILGARDAFAIKLNPSGTALWARNYGGAAAEATGTGIAVDGGGNVHLSGYFKTASLTSPALALIGTTDGFAIKTDSSGNPAWSRNFGGGGANAQANSIAVDSAGNVFVGGYYSDASLTTPALTRIGSRDSFALKFDAAGATGWARGYGGPGANTVGNAIAADGNGSLYLGGQFYGANLTAPTLTLIGYTDPYILRQSTKASQTISFGAPPTLVAGASATVSASASSGLAVTLASTTADVCSISGTQVTGVGAGICTIRAEQEGNAVFNEAPTATQSFAVSLNASTTGLGASVSPSVFGQSVTFTATVAGNAPDGTVAFYDGLATLCGAAQVAAGQAICATGALAVGSHSITAVYGGDSRNTGSASAPLAHSVNKADTAISIVSHAPDPSLIGAPVAVTVNLAAAAPGAGAPGGTITVGDGVATCVITTPANSCSLTFNTAGTRTLTASYGGNASFNPATSAGVGHSVVLAPTATAVGSSANPSIVGRPVTFTATVSGGAPTGSVDFRDGGVSIGGCGSKTLSGGSASCAAGALAPGRHGITAVYSGDAGHAGSESAILTQKVLSKGAVILPALLLLIQ